MKTPPALAPIAALVALAALGCSSSGSSCGGGGSCGGNLVGSWQVDTSASCVEGLTSDQRTAILTFCPQAAFDTSELALKGDVTFGSDGSYDQTLSFSGKLRLVIAAGCLTEQGHSLDCGKLPSTPGMVPGFTCAKNAVADCACAAAVASLHTTGSYTTKNGVLAQTPDGGSAVKSDYCVKGNELFSSPVASTGATKTGAVALRANLVLTKKAK